MKAGLALLIAADVIKLMKGVGWITDSYDFSIPLDGAQDAVFASRVEAILRTYGVDVPDKADKVINLIPLILELVK